MVYILKIARIWVFLMRVPHKRELLEKVSMGGGQVQT
jgi:hypothetical protein